MPALHDQVVLVTGAARGIGLACARLLAQQGARLVLNDLGCDEAGQGVDASVIEQVAAELRTSGADIVTDARDITEEGAAAALVELAISRYGRLDGLVSCAGVVERARFARTTAAQRGRAFAVGAEAPLALTHAAHAELKRAGGGSIVLMAGSAGLQGQRRDLAAAMAQGALLGLVRTAALELRPDGVRVNAVVPTALTRQTAELPLFQSGRAKLQPEHVAPLVVHLLSDGAAHVSGQILGVAGARFYACQATESDGYFGEGDDPLDLAVIAARWDEATR